MAMHQKTNGTTTRPKATIASRNQLHDARRAIDRTLLLGVDALLLAETLHAQPAGDELRTLAVEILANMREAQTELACTDAIRAGCAADDAEFMTRVGAAPKPSGQAHLDTE